MGSPRSRARRSPQAALRPARLLQVDSSTVVELDEALQFMRVLWVLVHALQKSSKRMNRQLGVTGPQRFAIRVVGLSPGISAGGLARILHLHPSTLTGILKRLEAQGILSRMPHPGDARRSVLRLLPKGQRLNVEMDGTVESAARATLQAVSAREQRVASGVLARLASQLDARVPGVEVVRPGRRRAGKRSA